MERRVIKGLVFVISLLLFAGVFCFSGIQAEARNINQPIAYDGHTHNYTGSRTVAATCTSDGAVYKVCACGAEQKSRTITRLGHNFSVKKSETSATCTSSGSITYKCSRCTCTSSTTIPAIGHDFSIRQSENAPTCTSYGSETYKCSRCTATQFHYTTILPHNSEGRVIEKATCTTDGAEYSICSMCYTYNKKKISTLPKTGHKFTKLISYKEATCEEDGVLVYGCANTGCTETKREIDVALGHNFSELVKTVPGTCQDYGYAVYKCTVGDCSATEKRPLSKGTHSYENKTENHCDRNGLSYKKCKYCGDVISKKEIAPISHDWNSNGTCKGCGKNICEVNGHHFDILDSYIESTCEKDGEYIYRCSNAGCTATKSVIDVSLGHNFSELVKTVPGTCQDYGYAVYRCTVGDCSATEKRPLSKGTHSYETKTENHCDRNGLSYKKCMYCGDVISKKEIAPISHDWNSNGTCKGCGKNICEVNGHHFDILDSYIESTCEKDGEYIYRCSNAGCTATKRVIDVSLGHNFSQLVKTVPGTCQEYGYAVYRCAVGDCGATEKRQILSRGSHDFSILTGSIESTCEDDGVLIYKCAYCSETRNVVNPNDRAMGHNFSELVETVPGTCQEYGYEVYRCTVGDCGATEKRQTLLKSNHDFSIFIGSIESTCEEDGKLVYKCAHCSETKNVVNPDDCALGHNFSELVETVPGTCQEYGYEVYRCTIGDCGATETRPTTAKGNHQWNSKDICTVCGKTKCELIGHDFSVFVSKKESTCEEDGEITYRCINYGCKETRTVVNPSDRAMGHNWDSKDKCIFCGASKCKIEGHTFLIESGYISATCSENGIVKYRCSNFGCSEEVSVDNPNDPATGIHVPELEENGFWYCQNCGVPLDMCCEAPLFFYTGADKCLPCNSICQVCKAELYKHSTAALLNAKIAAYGNSGDDGIPLVKFNNCEVESEEKIRMNILLNLSHTIHCSKNDTTITCSTCSFSQNVYGRKEDEFMYDFPIGGKLSDAFEQMAMEREDWANTPTETKELLIKNAVWFLSFALWTVEHVEVSFDQLGTDVWAQTSENGSTIYITFNESMINQASPVHLVAHEVRHAYQKFREKFPKTMMDYLLWVNDDDNYVRSGENYRSQIIEVDACAFDHLFDFIQCDVE